MPGENLPPMHPWCRSTTIVMLSGEALSAMERRARDPVTGKLTLVPGNMNYEKWYGRFVDGNPQAEDAVEKLKNLYGDKKQYNRYQSILGKEIPGSFELFQQMKYNDSKGWGLLKREADTVQKIKESTFTNEYKDKLLSTYYDLKSEGYEFKIHSLNRFLGQREGKDKKVFSKEDLLAVLGKPINYTQGSDGSGVKFYNGIAVIIDKDTRAVISVVSKNKIRQDWRPLD